MRAPIRIMWRRVACHIIFLIIIILLDDTLGAQSGLVDETCLKQGLTVCNLVSRKDCAFQSKERVSIGANAAVDPWSFMKTELLMDVRNSSDPKTAQRYLQLEWTRGNDQNILVARKTVLIRHWPLRGGSRREEESTCKSGELRDDAASLVPQADAGSKEQIGGRLSTLIPLIHNVTSYLVEIVFHDQITKYWIETAKTGKDDWILPTISVTTIRDEWIISLTPQKPRYLPQLFYTLTLIVCSQNKTNTPDSWINHWNYIRADDWGFDDCINIEKDNELYYDKTSDHPLIVKISHHTVQLWIDVTLIDGVKHISRSMRTPFFGLPHRQGHNHNKPASGSYPEQINNWQPQLPNPDTWKDSIDAEFSGPVAAASKSDDDTQRDDSNDKDGIVQIIAVIVPPTSVIIVIILVFAIKKAHTQTSDDDPDVILPSTIENEGLDRYKTCRYSIINSPSISDCSLSPSVFDEELRRINEQTQKLEDDIVTLYPPMHC